MRIAFYGGSFNPPHRGHIAAAAAVARTLQPDRFLIIPDRVPPHKELAEGSPAPEQRLELCRIAFAAVPGAEISDMELRREGRSYSIDTARELAGRYPGAERMLVLGSDMLLGFEKWVQFEEIFQLCTIVALSREGTDTAELHACADDFAARYGAKIRFVTHTPVVISSSEIRTALRSGGAREYLTEEELTYIRSHGLYGMKSEDPA